MGNFVTTDTINHINPTETNTKKKRSRIIIKLAHLLNYLSSIIVIGRFIRWAKLDKWARNILWPHSYNMATNIAEGPSQNDEEITGPKVKAAEVQTDPSPMQEEQAVQTKPFLPELETEVNELRIQLLDRERLKSEVDQLTIQLAEMHKMSEQLLSLVEETEKLKQELKQEREQSQKDAESSQTELTTKDGKINKLIAQVELLKNEKEEFAKYFAIQAQQLEKFQEENKLLLKNNGELNSTLEELKNGCKELEEAIKKQEEKFSKKLKQECERITVVTGKLIICIREFAEKIEKLEKEVQGKDEEISNLKRANEQSDEAKQAMETQKDKTISDQGEEIEKLNEELRQSEKSLEDANKQLGERDGTIQVITDENRNVKQHLQTKTSEFDDTVSKLQSDIGAKDAELKGVKEKLGKEQTKVPKLLAKLSSLRTCLENI